MSWISKLLGDGDDDKREHLAAIQVQDAQTHLRAAQELMRHRQLADAFGDIDVALAKPKRRRGAR